MRPDDLTPAERERVQDVLLRRHLQVRYPHAGRRKTDLPLPEVALRLSPSGVDRLARWVAQEANTR